jgi:uncharacterized membrane protein YeaQ/YmgE (transglycosylase-associated protein family)
MGIIAFIILGALAGAIAKALLPATTRADSSSPRSSGSLEPCSAASSPRRFFNAHPLDEFFDISTWLTAIVGSIVLLLIYRAVAGRSGTRATI